MCVCLIVDVKQEKTHQGLMAGVEAAPKLRHAETEEKVVLPSADGKSYHPALTVSLTTQRLRYEDYFLTFFIA